MGLLIDEKAHEHDITATIIDLAIRGYFKIKKKKLKKVFLGNKASYTFVKLKSASGLSGYERKVYNGIFKNNVRSVSMSTLQAKFYRNLKDIKSLLYKRVVDLSLFTDNPEKVRNQSCVIACLPAFLIFFW